MVFSVPREKIKKSIGFLIFLGSKEKKQAAWNGIKKKEPLFSPKFL